MQYTSMQKGLADIVGGIFNQGNPLGVDQGTYLEAMARRAQMDQGRAAARYYDQKSRLVDDQLTARGALRGSIPAVVSPPGGAPPQGAATAEPWQGPPMAMPSAMPRMDAPPSMFSPAQIVNMMLSGDNPNPQQAQEAALTAGRSAYIPEAVSAVRGGSFDKFAALNALINGIQTPALYGSGDHGQTFGTMSGRTVDQGALPDYAAKLRADAGYSTAAAGAQTAAAAASNALAAHRGYITVGDAVFQIPSGPAPAAPWQGVPYPAPAPGATAPPQLRQVGGPIAGAPGSIDPTTAARQFQEMLTLGVPRDLALGVSYGLLREVRDLMGNVTLVDLNTNQPLGQAKGGQWTPAPRMPAGAPPPPPGFVLDGAQ